MSKIKGCACKIKGGLRCGKDKLPGKNYCYDHAPKKTAEITTYSVGETKFSGSKSVKTDKYTAYLLSGEWIEKAKREKEINPNCSVCNRRGILHVHHRTYVRCGNEERGDLIVLCSDCHALFHKFYKYDGRVGYFKPIQ